MRQRILAVAGMLAAVAGVAVITAAQTQPPLPLGLDAYMPVPEHNPQTPLKIELGRRLFFDSSLSADDAVSCATCHDPRRAFADPHRVSPGAFGRIGRRNTPAILNRGYGSAFFWDGRAATLEEQVLAPIENPVELGSRVETAVARIGSGGAYVTMFRAAFGRGPSGADLARALASYVRSIVAGDSPVDRFLAGERGALSPEAQRGLQLFRGKGNCTACHLGPTFSDERFHNTGVAWTSGRLGDEGRAAVTGKAEDRGAFKTPTLRHVSETAPYMHDGSLARLEEVIEFYDRGGNSNPHLDPEIRPLRLSPAEKGSLVAFLRSLSGRILR